MKMKVSLVNLNFHMRDKVDLFFAVVGLLLREIISSNFSQHNCDICSISMIYVSWQCYVSCDYDICVTNHDISYLWYLSGSLNLTELYFLSLWFVIKGDYSSCKQNGVYKRGERRRPMRLSYQLTATVCSKNSSLRSRK